MTINNSTRTAGPFIGNGVLTVFPFSYKVFARADLLVALTVTATSVETIQVLDVDYTVALNADQDTAPGGTITMMVAPPVGTTMAATSNIDETQTMDLTNLGGFYPEVINQALDRVVIMIQQLNARVGLGALNVGAAAALAGLLNLGTSIGASLVGFIHSAIGAVGTTLQTRGRLVMYVTDFGVVGDGTDETVNIRKACAAAQLAKCDLIFPPTLAGYKTQMITFTSGGVRLIGHNTKIIQTKDASCVQIGGADYTVSAVFFFRPGCNRCSIFGFNFTQDATFGALPVTYTATSNFSPIVVYLGDYFIIDDCIFDCYMGRGIQFRGGNFGRIGDNNIFLNCGLTMAVGFTADAYYGDAVGIPVPFYSPTGVHVGKIKIYGSSLNSLARTSIHLTGCNDFTVDSPIIVGLNDATQVGIRIYNSDFGVTDIAGNVVSRWSGSVINPQVRGICTKAIELIGDGGGVDPVAVDVVLSGAIVDCTGIGIYAERFQSGKILGSHVRSSASPLWMGDSVENSEVSGYYECTTAATSLRTIFIGSTAEMVGINWHDMTVVMSAADEYAMDTIGVVKGPTGANFSNWYVVVATTSVASRALQLSECSGSVDLTNIKFDIKAAGISDRYLFSITEAAGAVLSLSCHNVKDISTNNTVYTRRGVVVNASDDVSFVNCDAGGLDITCTRDVLIDGCRVVQNRAGTPLLITGAALVKVSDSHIEVSVAGNVLGAEFVTCGKSKIHHSTVVTTNSTQPSIRATTSGVCEVDKVDISNTGTGVPYAVTGTGLIAGDLGAYAKDATLWSDANRPAATILQPGTTLWHSVDLMPEYSDGTAWRTPAGAVT